MLKRLQNWWTAHDRLASGLMGALFAVKSLKDAHDVTATVQNQHADALEKLALHLGLTWDDEAQDWTANVPATLEQIERAALQD